MANNLLHLEIENKWEAYHHTQYLCREYGKDDYRVRSDMKAFADPLSRGFV